MLMTNTKEFIDLAQKVVTIIAVFVGGLWTYKLYIEHREPYTKATISQSITCIRLPDKANLLRLNVTIKNSGNILLRLFGGEVRIKHVLPLMPDMVKQWEAIKRGKQISTAIFHGT